MAVNPIITVIYKKETTGGSGGNQGGGMPKRNTKNSATSALSFFRKVKRPISLIEKSPMGVSMAIYLAMGQVAQKGVNFFTKLDEAKTGNKLRNYNINQRTNMIVNPFAYAKKGIWEYGVVQPMVVNRQNEMLMYDRRLTGNIIYGEGKQKGIF